MPSEIPLPLSLAFDNPIVKGMTPPERGAYIAIIDGFWREQVEIPEEDWKRAVMARCSVRQWNAVREKVNKAVAKVLPSMVSVYRTNLEKKSARIAQARKAYEASPLAVRYRNLKKADQLSDTVTETLPAIPAEHLSYKGNGKYDDAARRAAVSRESSAAKPQSRKGSLSERAGSKKG